MTRTVAQDELLRVDTPSELYGTIQTAIQRLHELGDAWPGDDAFMAMAYEARNHRRAACHGERGSSSSSS